MSVDAKPTAEHYRLLRRLRRLVLRSDDAALVFLWGADPRSLGWLRGELDRALRARSRRVLLHALPDPSAPRAAHKAALADALGCVLEPAPGSRTFAVWIDTGWSPEHPWRDRLLARLNERRLQLLQQPRPVFIAGPAAAEARAGAVAPDLWAVRAASFHVPPWPADSGEAAGALSAPPAIAPPQQPFAFVPLWQDAWRAYVRRGAGGADDVGIDTELGWAAAQELLRHGRPAPALDVLRQTGELVERAAGDEPAMPDRATAVQWSIEGDALRASGKLPAARERYEQSLELRERLVRLIGESPEALRDSAIAWERLTLTAEAEGDVVQARDCFERELSAAEAAARLWPLDADIRRVVEFARSRLDALATPA